MQASREPPARRRRILQSDLYRALVPQSNPSAESWHNQDRPFVVGSPAVPLAASLAYRSATATSAVETPAKPLAPSHRPPRFLARPSPGSQSASPVPEPPARTSAEPSQRPFTARVEIDQAQGLPCLLRLRLGRLEDGFVAPTADGQYFVPSLVDSRRPQSPVDRPDTKIADNILLAGMVVCRDPEVEAAEPMSIWPAPGFIPASSINAGSTTRSSTTFASTRPIIPGFQPALPQQQPSFADATAPSPQSQPPQSLPHPRDAESRWPGRTA